MVKINTKATLDNAALDKFILRKQKLIRDNVRAVMRNKAVPHLIDLIMKGYDSLSERADMSPEDPTNPARWRSEFKAKLEEDLLNTFSFDGTHLKVRLGEKNFLGYIDGGGLPDPTDSSPLTWLVFFIEGLIGDWAFITPENYEKFRGAGSYDNSWGRFNNGFMISREDYFEEGWNEIIPWQSVRHPFSGFAPLDIFAEALNEFKIRPFIEIAIRASVQGTKL